jgi:CheY-like chemotaxis protein
MGPLFSALGCVSVCVQLFVAHCIEFAHNTFVVGGVGLKKAALARCLLLVTHSDFRRAASLSFQAAAAFNCRAGRKFLPGLRCQRSYSVSKHERHHISIYLVDDEELITKSLAHILRNEGFAVTPFNNPLKALARMKTHAPDLLISDVMMPELSGLDLAAETRKMLPACKILLFSGAADDLQQNAAERVAGFRLLSKPLHPNLLLQEIELLTGVCSEPYFERSLRTG